MISIYVDGGARGNPGPAAIGVWIKIDEKEYSISETIGISTNNVAEYKALNRALEWIIASKDLIADEEILINMDSELVYSQIVGLYKVKNANLRELLFNIREKEAQIKNKLRYSHIPRELNKNADKLVNLVLDRIRAIRKPEE